MLFSYRFRSVKGCTHRAMILYDGAVESHRKQRQLELLEMACD